MEGHVVPVHAVKAYGLINAGLHSFLNSAAEGTEGSGLIPGSI
jgi:hypothetical protein